jgi:4-amino-4-deoxy-L-arabinose transferase-like glycosyltransferase
LKLIRWLVDHPWWLLIGVALIMRILPVTVRFVIGSDEGLFLTLGQNLAAGRGYTGDGLTTQIDFPPGFALFAAAVYRLGGYLELPAHLNILVIGSLLPLPIYWLARQLSDAKTALLAGLLVALHPALVLSQGNLESVAEQPYGLLLYTAWGLLWWGFNRRRGWIFGLAGVLVGLAHLVRWEGIIMGLIAVVIIVIALRRTAVGPVLLFLTGLALFAVPYGWYLYQHTGSILSPKTMLTQLHAAALDASVNDPFAFERSFYEPYEIWLAHPTQPPEVVAESRTAALRRYAGNVWLEARLWFTSFSFMTIFWIVPFGFGLWAMGRKQTLFLLPLFIPLAFIPASVVDPRYFLIPLPILMIFTARGWMWLQDKLPSLRLPLVPQPVSLAMLWLGATLVLFILASLSGPFLYPRPVEYRRAGLALRQQIPPDAHILARKRQLPFYAGGVWDWLPLAELDDVLAYAQSHEADYLVLDQYTTPELRPQLAFLLDPAQAPASLTPLYRGDEVIIYQINWSVER